MGVEWKTEELRDRGKKNERKEGEGKEKRAEKGNIVDRWSQVEGG